jgi:hypothetical protein
VVTPQEGVIFTDIVAAMPRRNFSVATDPLAGLTTLAGSGLAVLDIRSVYNLDGAVVNNAGQPATPQFILDQVDPANAAYQQRRARFIQIVQGVPIPDRDDEIPAGANNILEVENADYGISRNQLMRFIVGYAPIEPDGSVAVKVPADIPLTFNILDGNGQRISPRHNVWWQLREGEKLSCSGCHAPTSEVSHGRLDSRPPEVNPGAVTASGMRWAFPISQPLLMTGTAMGQTQAQIWAANHAEQPRTLSVNVFFQDEWSMQVGQKNPDIDYRYTNNDPARPQQVPVPPLNSATCQTTWRPDCRIIINYLDHIQPIWDKSRIVDVGGMPTEHSCVSCHVQPWLVNAVAQPPAGQLELTGGPSSRSADFVMSYSELFTADTQKDAAGAEVLVPDVDADGNPILVTVPVGNTMSTNGSINSARFFGCFRVGSTCGVFNGGVVTAANGVHVGLLTPAELRLLSEWLDIGAQYYNDVVKAATAP